VPRTDRKAAHYRMQDLVKATATPKSTLLFYLAQGLLPQPQRTGPNTALYAPACVERIRLIRHLRSRERLTLAEIRERLETAPPDELSADFRPDEAVFGPPGGGSLGRADFCRATGLRPGEVDDLLRARLLQPQADDAFDRDDVAVGRLYRGVLDAGIRPHDLSYYIELSEAMVAAEMALRDRLTDRLPRAQNAAAVTALVRSARTCCAYLLDRISRNRAALTHSKVEEPRPQREEREPWLD